jgi:hypothetical protein
MLIYWLTMIVQSHVIAKSNIYSHLRVFLSGQQVRLVLLSSRVRPSTYTSIISAVPYLFTGLSGCSVDPGNSRGARKLTRTPRVIKKKSQTYIHFIQLIYLFPFLIQFLYNLFLEKRLLSMSNLTILISYRL